MDQLSFEPYLKAHTHYTARIFLKYIKLCIRKITAFFADSCSVCEGCYATFELKRYAYMYIMKSKSNIGFSSRDNTSLPNSRFGAHFTNFLSDVEILQANSTVNAKWPDWHDHERLTVYFTLPSRLQALGRHKLHQPRPPQSKFLSVIKDTKKFKRKLLSVCLME